MPVNPNQSDRQPKPNEERLPARRPGLLQVAKTMFFGVLMIGKKGTWEKGGEGAQMTPGQIVVGAIIGGIVLIALLITIVRVALRLASI